MKLLSYLLIVVVTSFGTGDPCSKKQAVIYKDTTVTKFFQREHGCIAGDGGFSIPLSDNKVMWLMGDSHIDDYDPVSKTIPCMFQVRNAAMVQPLNKWDNNQTTTLTGTGSGFKSYLKNNPNDSFFCWPSSGVQLKDTVFVYCASLKNQGTGAFGFASSGNDFMAAVTVKDMQVKNYQLLPDFKGISFGLGFVKDNVENWVYVYGQKYIPAKIQCDLYVARFSANKPSSNWQYWNGFSWIIDIDGIKPVASQVGVSGTFQVSKVKNKYLLLSSALSINCDSGTEIYAAVADSIIGPFTSKKTLYTIDDRLNGHTPFFYAAIAHPEYINDKNELLVTYAINGYGTCVPDCVNGRMNPDLYRLKGIRVPCNLLF